MQESARRELGDIVDIGVGETSAQPQHGGDTLQVGIALCWIDGRGKVHHDGKLVVAEREHRAPL